MVLHSFSYTIQEIDMAPTGSQLFQLRLGRRIAALGTGAVLFSSFALVASIRVVRPGAGHRTFQLGLVGSAAVALVLCVIAEIAVAPRLWNFRPELEAVEAFELPGPLDGLSTPEKIALPNPAVVTRWYYKGSVEEVEGKVAQAIAEWADDGTVNRVSDDPLTIRARRGSQFATVDVLGVPLIASPGDLVTVSLSVRRNEFYDHTAA